MKPVHLVLFLRSLKSPNTDEAVAQRNQVTVFVVRLPSLPQRTVMGCWVIRGVYWSCSCRILGRLGVIGCAYEICQIQKQRHEEYLSF